MSDDNDGDDNDDENEAPWNSNQNISQRELLSLYLFYYTWSSMNNIDQISELTAMA